MRITVEKPINPPSSWVFAIDAASIATLRLLHPFQLFSGWKGFFFFDSEQSVCHNLFNGKLWAEKETQAQLYVWYDFWIFFADWHMGPCKWPEHDWKSEGKDGEHHRLTHQQDAICVYNTGKYSVIFWRSTLMPVELELNHQNKNY